MMRAGIRHPALHLHFVLGEHAERRLFSLTWMSVIRIPLRPRCQSLDELASRLAGECEWLVANDVLPADLVTRNRRLAETALRP
jgi:hypothetical protein